MSPSHSKGGEMKLTLASITKMYKKVKDLDDQNEQLILIMPPSLHKKILKYGNVKLIKNKKVPKD